MIQSLIQVPLRGYRGFDVAGAGMQQGGKPVLSVLPCQQHTQLQDVHVRQLLRVSSAAFKFELNPGAGGWG
jgi:hypothetical protein